MAKFLPLFLVLAVLAAIFRQTTVLTILYLIGGMYVAGRWWSQRTISRLEVQRLFTQRAFLDQEVPVVLQITNGTRLPLVWLKLHESLPVGMATPSFFHSVISLPGKGCQEMTYRLNALKRGYYPIGPLFLTTGDLIGIAPDEQRQVDPDFLIIYPRIVPLRHLRLPSRSPFGNFKERNPLFEDPSRTLGKRDYHGGDSLRRVDWKATASSGRMLVKVYEPTIALETVILLNLDAEDYELRHRYELTELAIIAAASIANWANQHHHTLGLVTNGIDPLSGNLPAQPIPARKGTAHLGQALDLLARVESTQQGCFERLLVETGTGLPWGTNLVAITGKLDDPLLHHLLPLKRRGLNPVLVTVGPILDLSLYKQHAEHFGIPVFPIHTVLDLEEW